MLCIKDRFININSPWRFVSTFSILSHHFLILKINSSPKESSWNSGVTGSNPRQVRFEDFRKINWSQLEIIIITPKMYFLQLILIWTWYIHETCVLITKFKVPWPLLSESGSHYFTSRYQFFTTYKTMNVPWQNLSNFLGAF